MPTEVNTDTNPKRNGNISWNSLAAVITIIAVFLGGVWILTHDYVTQREFDEVRVETRDSLKHLDEEIKKLDDFERNWERNERAQLYKGR